MADHAGGPFRPIRTRRSFEEALDQILELITTGDLRIGERVPPEREIARAMGISRPTLREALKLLIRAGMIEVRSRSGGMYVCSDVVPADLRTDQYATLLEEVGHVLETRRLVESQVAQVAGRTATEDDFAALDETIALQRRHLSDHDWMLQLDERFHLALAGATRNPMLMELVRTILRRLAIARDMTPRRPQDPELEIAIHERTLDALRSREPRAIAQAMDEHMSYLEDIWEQETGLELLRLHPAAAARRGDDASLV